VEEECEWIGREDTYVFEAPVEVLFFLFPGLIVFYEN
jgi:hypothetical protein